MTKSVTLNEDERLTVTALLSAFVHLPHDEQQRMLGSIGVPKAYRLERKLYYYYYWSKHGIRFEDMTENDYVDAYLERA